MLRKIIFNSRGDSRWTMGMPNARGGQCHTLVAYGKSSFKEERSKFWLNTIQKSWYCHYSASVAIRGCHQLPMGTNQGKPVVQHALVPIFIFVYSTPDFKSFGLKLVLLTKVLQQNKQIVPSTSVDWMIVKYQTCGKKAFTFSVSSSGCQNPTF